MYFKLLKVIGLNNFCLKFYKKNCQFLVPKAMSPLHVQSNVCMALLHVQSKVCIAPFHVWSNRTLNGDMVLGTKKWPKLPILQIF